jgi:hypothetical protein
MVEAHGDQVGWELHSASDLAGRSLSLIETDKARITIRLLLASRD